ISENVAFSIRAIARKDDVSDKETEALLSKTLGLLSDEEALGKLSSLRCPRYMTAKDASAYVEKFLKTLSDCGDFLDKKAELVIDSFERNLTHPKLKDIVRLRRGG
ncbi:hypothetical protein ADUPG1_004584, partial [Aduncisulcus paluster]